MDLSFTNLLRNRLRQNFFSRPTLEIARELLGKYFVVNINDQLKIVRITETEAYIGQDDLASHARFGKTKRNEIMYGPPGRLYIYLVYGIYYLLNIITEPENSPAGVLIRGGNLIVDSEATNFSHAIIRGAFTEGREYDKISLPNYKTKLTGPGKFTRALNIDKKYLGLDLTTSQEIFISESGLTPQIITTPRIGIDYAPEPWKSMSWRFVSVN